MASPDSNPKQSNAVVWIVLACIVMLAVGGYFGWIEYKKNEAALEIAESLLQSIEERITDGCEFMYIGMVDDTFCIRLDVGSQSLSMEKTKQYMSRKVGRRFLSLLSERRDINANTIETERHYRSLIDTITTQGWPLRKTKKEMDREYFVYSGTRNIFAMIEHDIENGHLDQMIIFYVQDEKHPHGLPYKRFGDYTYYVYDSGIAAACRIKFISYRDTHPTTDEEREQYDRLIEMLEGKSNSKESDER